VSRKAEGSAGDADYRVIGQVYTDYRWPDRVFAAAIEEALSKANTMLNVGAGTGSYELGSRRVIAVEPSASMRATTARQRPKPAGWTAR